MLDLSSTTIAIMVALAATGLAVLLLDGRKPKRAEKWEKAAIMKQLLAASEREESMQQMKQSMRAHATSSTPAVKAKTNVAAAGKTR